MSDVALEIWVSHESVNNWNNPLLWNEYLDKVGAVLKAPLTHLDENDPVRKKPLSNSVAADYICAFNENENRRLLFGRYKSIDAARQEKSGAIVRRERIKNTEYDNAGIPSHFEQVN